MTMPREKLPKNTAAFRECGGCSNEQGDCGSDVSCEECGECDWSAPYFYADSAFTTKEFLVEGYDYDE